MSFVHVGFGNMIDTSRIIAIANYAQPSIQELVKEAELSKVIDSSEGHKIKSVIFTDDGRLILCRLSPELLLQRSA